MSDSGFASLGPTLLARKGGAKPAMRPQLPVLSEPAEVAKLADEQLEDLGWNDMGEDNGAEEDGTPANVVVPIDPDAPFDPALAEAHSPIVRRQQRRLEERVLADAVMTGPEDCDTEIDDDEATAFEAVADAYADAEDTAFTVSAPAPSPIVAKVPAIQAIPAKRSASAGRRAAFTLRLDPQRHLKLRLAATMQGVSAQALVTDALDRLLAEIDELDAIAARVQRH
ncbi:MAG: toxin-antitoxin system HicB family antitoxin [Erythrobacter sp.]